MLFTIEYGEDIQTEEQDNQIRAKGVELKEQYLRLIDENGVAHVRPTQTVYIKEPRDFMAVVDAYCIPEDVAVQVLPAGNVDSLATLAEAGMRPEGFRDKQIFLAPTILIG